MLKLKSIKHALEVQVPILKRDGNLVGVLKLLTDYQEESEDYERDWDMERKDAEFATV